MENIVLWLKLMRGVSDPPLVYVVRQPVKVAHILHGYSAYLNLDDKMIVRAPIVNAMSNIKQTQDCLSRVYVS